MKANEFLKVACTVERPICNYTPVVRLRCSDSKRLGIEIKSNRDAIYNFKTGDVENVIYNKPTPDNYVNVEIFNAIGGSTKRIKEHIYFEYLPEYNATAICLARFDATCFKMGEKRNFDVVDYYFITEDKYFVYKRDDQWVAENDKILVGSELPFSYYLYPIALDNIREELAKQCGIIKSNSGYDFVREASDLTNYMFDNIAKVDIQPLTKKLQTFSDKILDIELSPITMPDTKSREYRNYAKLEYVNPEVSVIRWFIYFSDSVILEYMRFYVTDEMNFLCGIENDKKFHVLVKKICKDDMLIEDLIWDKEELKNSKFRYILDMIETFSTDKKASSIYDIFKFELLEKFAKTGLNNLVNYSMNTYRSSRILPYTTIGEIFSVKINPKETDIYKATGLNKYQYKKVAEKQAKFQLYKMSIVSLSLRSMRILFKNDEIAAINDIDNATFDKFFDMVFAINSIVTRSSNVNLIIAALSNVYSLNAIYNILRVSFILNQDNVIDNRGHRRYLLDYVRMACKLNDPKSFPLKFKNYENPTELFEELKTAHDAVNEVYILVNEKIKIEEFNKQLTKCAKWEYKTETLSVVSPTHPGDLAKEGLELHHCVKSYISRVCSGDTNILFIRKTDDIDTPFFTVEVSNSGNLEQVHGFANRNANTEPGLEDFIKDWAKNKKIKLTNFNKVR